MVIVISAIIRAKRNKADINTIWGQFMSMASGENCISVAATRCIIPKWMAARSLYTATRLDRGISLKLDLNRRLNRG